MTSLSHFPDWCSLSISERAVAFVQCQRRLGAIGRRLNAVEQIFTQGFSSRSPLSGMPYVAKDMIATGRSAPSWGCSSPQARSAPQASIIDRLDQAGAVSSALRP
jgi:Asp-tRNA(Asn)/Glu-tRNA(Gln) amidotransferase A subunit family amidase